MESTHLKARVICNPAASGGGYEPEDCKAGGKLAATLG